LILFVVLSGELPVLRAVACECATRAEPKCLSGNAPARRSREARALAASSSMKLSKTLNVFMRLNSLFHSGKKSECRAFLRQCLDDKNETGETGVPARAVSLRNRKIKSESEAEKEIAKLKRGRSAAIFTH
jgi:hypothetical protein